jgi:hypothetical protein
MAAGDPWLTSRIAPLGLPSPVKGVRAPETVGGGYHMHEHPLFEQLWNGSAQMEEWTAAVSQGAVTSVADNIITVHTTYFCGSVTAIRTVDG